MGGGARMCVCVGIFGFVVSYFAPFLSFSSFFLQTEEGLLNRTVQILIILILLIIMPMMMPCTSETGTKKA